MCRRARRPPCSRLRPVILDELLDVLEDVVRNRDRQVVLRDLPRLAVEDEHAAAAARTEVWRREVLVEPCRPAVGRKGHAATDRLEAPRLALGEVRMCVRLKLRLRPPLG